MSKEMIEREIIKYYDRETGRYVGEKRRENKYEILYDNRRSEIEEYGEGEEEENGMRGLEKQNRDKQRNATKAIFCVGMATAWLDRNEEVATVEKLLSTSDGNNIALYALKAIIEKYG